MQKNYHLDTNVLLEREDAINILRNGEENKINISITVINELDHLLKDNNKRPKTSKAIQNIWDNRDYINFTGDVSSIINNDDRILRSVDGEEPILVTNDRLLQLKAYICGINSEEFKDSLPFKSESEKYTGFIDWYKNEDYINNCFYFKNGKLFFWNGKKERCIDYEREIWKVKPKDVYQKAAIELLTDRNIPLTTIQSKSGTGKSLLSLASALYMTFEKKLYNKIIIIKSSAESSEYIGYRPGNVEQKMEPIWNNLYKLLLELHEVRPFNKAFIDPESPLLEINPRFIEFAPLNFMRGDNIKNAYVVVDEGQNIPRHEMRTLLTRMGENCKVVVEGDTSQVDHPRCNTDNNGLNWVVKLLKGDKRYAHLKMNCKQTRGPICDMVTYYNL